MYCKSEQLIPPPGRPEAVGGGEPAKQIVFLTGDHAVLNMVNHR